MTGIATEMGAPPLRQIEEIVRRELGRPVQAVAERRLTSRQGIEVWRVGLDPDSPWSSVIVKHLLPGGFPGLGREQRRLDLLRESLNYVFLSELRPSFELFPRLVGRSEGLLVLEDLGKDTYDYPSDEAVWASVASTFAKLHATSAGRGDRYAAIHREMADVSKPAYRKVRNGEGLFRQGAQIVAELCHALRLPQAQWSETLQAVWAEIADPGPFLTFIHDDVVSRRQSITCAGRFHLLDFEWAEYSHALLDVSRLLVGKVERNREYRRYFIHQPDFPLEFAHLYRRELEALRGQDWADEVWAHALGSALVYTTLGVLAVLFRLPESLQAMTSPELCLKGLLDRTTALLRGVGTYPDASDLFARLSERIYITPAAPAP